VNGVNRVRFITINQLVEVLTLFRLVIGGKTVSSVAEMRSYLSRASTGKWSSARWTNIAFAAGATWYRSRFETTVPIGLLMMEGQIVTSE
jgi:hypothetical protein